MERPHGYIPTIPYLCEANNLDASIIPMKELGQLQNRSSDLLVWILQPAGGLGS